MTRLHRPTTLSELTRLYAELPDAMFLAGGAGVMLRLHKGPVPDDVIDTSRVEEIRGIQVGRFGTWLGALSTLRAVADDPLVRKSHPALAAACAYGPPQIRGRASLGGSLAGRRFDILPALLAHRCQVELISHNQPSRRLRVVDFLEEKMAPGEVIRALHLPPRAEREHSLFRRIQTGRGDYVVCARLVLGDGVVSEVAVVVGDKSLGALHLSAVEEALAGRPLSSRPADLVPYALGGGSTYLRSVASRVLRSWLEHLQTLD
ncbi:MAG: FAD binding domain-containing protein [Myxococcota bacterium]|nr:FAD binding domain-containing protein [Myxococcota bacterium]